MERRDDGLKLSAKGKYSLLVIYHLGEHYGEGPIPLKDIAHPLAQGDYLEQLIGTLRRAGLVTAVRGANGGYLLSREPSRITLGDIIRAAEGPVSFAECVGDERACPKAGNCPTQPVWNYLTEQIDRMLDGMTLQDMMDNPRMTSMDRECENA